MMYSDIVGESYYRIQLPRKHKYAVDIFFYTAAHHRWRMNAAVVNNNCKDYVFHRDLYHTHLKKLMDTIHKHGVFSHAIDKTKRGLNRAKGWDYNLRFGSVDLDNPIESDQCLPDPEMFDDMGADYRFEQGEPHGYDYLLEGNGLTVELNAANA
jgi:hypothetical protein